MLLLPAAAFAQTHLGGTLKLTASAAAGTIDPQINYEEKYNQIYAFTQDGLVTYRKTGGSAGRDVVPDLAESLPTISTDGKTYLFHLRRGLKFSTGAPITVNDVAASFRRLFKVASPNAGSWYSVIQGADTCLAAPVTCTLPGVITNDADNSVTIHLTQPSSEFLQQLAMSFAIILPANTPSVDLGTTPPVATGPYMIASYDPTREMRLVRNPYFHEWSRDAQPAGFVDQITYRFGVQDESEVTEVENGQQDWMFDEKPLDRLPELGTNYANLVHINPIAAYYYLPMNTRLPPFNNIDARRAVSYAINRRALVNLFGGPAMATPLCHLLPEGIPGYVASCAYTKNPGTTWTAPDLALARKLVEKSGTKGEKVTLITSDKEVERTIGIYLQSVLNDIGYQASVRAISSNIEFTYSQNTQNKVQISLTDWYQDYPAASDFLQVMFSCANFHPNSDSSINIAGYCNPALDKEMDQALNLEATNPPAAADLWTKIDEEITNAAPAAGLFQVNYLDIIAPRVGNFQFSPIYHTLFSQLWVK